MAFADQLKALRKERGLSQQALADAVFVSRSAVAKWENGLGLPGGDCYAALLAFFDVDANRLTIDEAQRKRFNQRLRSRTLLRVGGTTLSLCGILTLAWGRIVIRWGPPSSSGIMSGLPDQMYAPNAHPSAEWKWLTQMAAQLREWMRITPFNSKDLMFIGLFLVLSAAICFFCAGYAKRRT